MNIKIEGKLPKEWLSRLLPVVMKSGVFYNDEEAINTFKYSNENDCIYYDSGSGAEGHSGYIITVSKKDVINHMINCNIEGVGIDTINGEYLRTMSITHGFIFADDYNGEKVIGAVCVNSKIVMIIQMWAK